MANYVTIEDVRAYGYQSLPEDEGLFGAILTRASRLFDRACGLPDKYFAKGDSGQVASARKFWGKGTDFLKLDPYLAGSLTAVAMPDGWTVPSYLEANHGSRPELATPGEFFLVRLYGENEARFDALAQRQDWFPAEFNEFDYIGWPAGIKATVTAKWGWDAVPEDVKEAVIETTIAIWRSRDHAFARAVALDTNTLLFEALPSRVKLIAGRYRAGKFVFA